MSADLIAALTIAEAALADIGDADREPEDDLAWCEARAAEALPTVRAALAAAPERPTSLEWADSPQRTQWGAGMMEALLPLGKDYTLRLYAERAALHLVPQALSGAHTIARPLTDEQAAELLGFVRGVHFNAPGLEVENFSQWNKDRIRLVQLGYMAAAGIGAQEQP